MVSKGEAIELVSSILNSDKRCLDPDRELIVDEERVSEIWWAWIVPYCARAFTETKSIEHTLVGAGPYLVDKFSGEIMHTGWDYKREIKVMERKLGYRYWWKFW